MFDGSRGNEYIYKHELTLLEFPLGMIQTCNYFDLAIIRHSKRILVLSQIDCSNNLQESRIEKFVMSNSDLDGQPGECRHYRR